MMRSAVLAQGRLGGLVASALNKRAMSTTAAVRFAQPGQPADVLKYEENVPVGKVGPDDVALKILAAPINPADLNFVEGIYGNKAASFPCIPGGEGVAKVTQVGGNVKNLKEGDWVIPAGTGFGFWRSAAVGRATDFIKVTNEIAPAYAATLLVNPCTSYRLLADFGNLKEGDWIIQNGANSMVGLGVIQMARERGVKTINIVRHDRPEALNICRMLTNYGGDINVLDDYVPTQGFMDIVNDLPGPIKLGLNTTGGESATALARVLGDNGTLVTYGAMSRKPLTIPYDLLVSKQLKLKGFWMSAWHEANKDSTQRLQMINEIAQMIKDRKLSYHYELHDFDDFDFALKRSLEPFRLRKVVLNMDYPDRFKEHDAKTEEDYEKFQLPSMIQ